MTRESVGADQSVSPTSPVSDRCAADIREMLARSVELADRCAAIAVQRDDDLAFPEEEFRLIANAGLLSVPLSRARGGLGLHGVRGTFALLKLLKEMGRANLSIGRVYEGHVNALQLIDTFGVQAQIDEWAADASQRQMLFAVWNTEATDGVRLVPTDDGAYRLEGAKTFASGAGHVQRPIVTGRMPDGGWQMCVVAMEHAHVAIDPAWWRPLGMAASTSFRVDFSGVIISENDLVGAPGDYYRQPWFSGGAIRFAAVQLGGAEALLDATRAYLRSLQRTEDPYQRARIGEAAIVVESGNHWLRAAAAIVDLGPRIDTEHSVEAVLAYANMLRTAIETLCLDVIRIAERAVGARGLLRTYPIERMVRDLTMYLRQPAPDAALANVGQFVLDSDAPLGALWVKARE